MLRLCPARAFMAFACLCTTRLSVGRSRDGGSFSRFPTVVAVAAAVVTDGVAISLSAAWGGVFAFWISTVSSRDDSVIFDLQICHIVKPVENDRCQWRETE